VTNNNQHQISPNANVSSSSGATSWNTHVTTSATTSNNSALGVAALLSSAGGVECAFASLSLPSTQEVMASFTQLAALLGSGEELKRMNFANQLGATKC
jgi:hypothetical protein